MLSSVAGVILLLLAVLVPSGAWVHLLRNTQGDLSAKLLTGGLIFRACLASLGLFVLAGGRLGWWRWTGTADRATPAAEEPEVGGSSFELVALGLVTIGAVLRLYRLDGGLWNDEVMTLVDSVRLPIGELVTTYGSQNQHFLYSLLAHLSTSALGEAAWTLRLPAALFGIATLWAMWRFGRLVAGPREALLALAMLTFSPQHIWFSQNARGYSALLFWTIVSSHFLIRGLRESDRRLWLAYAVTTALGMYTHLTMIFVVAGQFVAYVWHMTRAHKLTWTERLAPLFGGFVLAGLLTLVCYALVIPQIPEASAADRSDVAVWRSPVWMLLELARGAQAGPFLPLTIALGLGIAGSGFISYWRRSPTLPMLFAIPVVSGAVTMFALGHHLWPRFFFFAAGFAILFIVRGLILWAHFAGGFFRLTPARSAIAGTAIVLLAVAFLGRSIQFVYGPKQDYEGARNFVEEEREPGDAIVTVGGAAGPFRLYYAPGWGSISTAAELEQTRARSERTWLVYAIPLEVENTYPEIYRVSQQEFQLMRVFNGTLNGGAIYVFRESRRRTGSNAAEPATRKGS